MFNEIKKTNNEHAKMPTKEMTLTTMTMMMIMMKILTSHYHPYWLLRLARVLFLTLHLKVCPLVFIYVFRELSEKKTLRAQFGF